MKKYIGTKEIKARPMSAAAASLCGYKLGNSGEIEGYEVEYEDGYRSWSPKDVFEKAYKPADTFKDRLIIEKDELVDRHCKLGDFLSNKNFEKVVQDEEQRDLLCQQYKAMGEYLMILKRRIETIK